MTRKMKDSGIEWIGEIPEEWKTIKFNALYDLRNQKVSDRDFPPLSVTKNGIVPQLSSAAKTNDGDNRKLVKVGDFAINSRSDRRGSCGISKYEGSVSLINTVLRPINNEMNPDYYNLLFHTFEFADEFYKWGHGIVDDLWTTNWQDMKNITLVYPSKKEQDRIASVLNKKVKQINQTSKTIQQEIDALEEYRKSLITETVTKGLDKTVPMKDSGIEWIGEIPENWEPIKLKFLSDKIDRGTTPNYTKEHITKVVNQATFSKGFFDKSDIKFSSINANQSRGLLKKKDILIASTGGGVLGKTLYYQENDTYVADSHVTIIRINPENYDSKLIYYLLSVNYELINGTMAQGSTNQIELQKNLLANFYVPYIPNEKERKRIVEFLDNSSSLINSIIENKKEQLKILTKYKQSIIYEYVTGKKQVSEKEGVKNAQ